MVIEKSWPLVDNTWHANLQDITRRGPGGRAGQSTGGASGYFVSLEQLQSKYIYE